MKIGKIILKEPEKLPAAGKALVTVLGAPEGKPNWDKVMSLLGTMRHPADGMAVEQTARAEWDERERLIVRGIARGHIFAFAIWTARFCNFMSLR